MKIIPEDESETRALPLRLKTDGDLIYFVPCIGFDLDETSIGEWTKWDLLTTSEGTLIQILKLKDGLNITDPKYSTIIKSNFKNNQLPKMNSLPRQNGTLNQSYTNRGGRQNTNPRDGNGSFRGRRNNTPQEHNIPTYNQNIAPNNVPNPQTQYAPAYPQQNWQYTNVPQNAFQTIQPNYGQMQLQPMQMQPMQLQPMSLQHNPQPGTITPHTNI